MQGQENLRQQREVEQAQQQWVAEIAAAERDLGRSISPGEQRYLAWEAQQPDSKTSIREALNDYLTPENDTPEGRREHRVTRMTNSIEAMHEAHEPEQLEVIPDASENYGCPEGTSPTSQEYREARTNHMIQQRLISEGRYGYVSED